MHQTDLAAGHSEPRGWRLGDLLGPGGRLPRQLGELRGPATGVIKLPRHLSWPGLREWDISDDRVRRSIYGLLLVRGKREDIARFVNGARLRQDWPLIRNSIHPPVRRQCERLYDLRSSGGRTDH